MPNIEHITKEEFMAYVNVQESGQFNMITEWPQACTTTGLTSKTYFDIIENYSELRKKFMPK